jgi:hypothetical protein
MMQRRWLFLAVLPLFGELKPIAVLVLYIDLTDAYNIGKV